MIKPWKELSRELVFKKYFWNIQKRVYELPSGEKADYYIHTANPYAFVLALTKDNKVVTIKQYRPGPDTICTELPGGIAEDNEAAIEAALRELREETGYKGKVVWQVNWQFDGHIAQQRNVVVVKDAEKVSNAKLDSTEFIEVELLDIEKFVALVRGGKVLDTGAALLGLDYLGFLK